MRNTVVKANVVVYSPWFTSQQTYIGGNNHQRLADPHLEELIIEAILGNIVDHYQRLHTPSKILHRRIPSIPRTSDDYDGYAHAGRLQCTPLVVVFMLDSYRDHHIGEHDILLKSLVFLIGTHQLHCHSMPTQVTLMSD